MGAECSCKITPSKGICTWLAMGFPGTTTLPDNKSRFLPGLPDEFCKRLGDNNLLRGKVVGVEGDFCRVETGGQIVTAFRVAPCRLGDSVSVAIRPERVAVAPEPGLYGNEFDGRIDDIAFLGDHLRLRMTVCDSPDFIAKIPNIVGHGAVLEGDRVRVGWTLTDGRALESGDLEEGSP